MPIDIVAFAYAATVAAGGLLGYIRKGSVMSGLMGVTAGGLMALGAYQTSVDPNDIHLSLGVSGGLFGLMGYRFVKSGKFMPAGLVAALSLAMVVRYSLHAAGYKVTKSDD